MTNNLVNFTVKKMSAKTGELAMVFFFLEGSDKHRNTLWNEKNQF